MPLNVNIKPPEGSPGSKVTLEVEEFDIENRSDYVRATVVGQAISRKLTLDEDGKFSTETTIPWGAPSGTYQIEFESSNGEKIRKEVEIT